MARRVSIYVSTGTNGVAVLDHDNVTFAPNNAIFGGFGEWRVKPSNTIDLTDLSARISMVNRHGDIIGDFSYAELGGIEIDSVSQAGSVTNLQSLLGVFGPYIFQDDLTASLAALTTIANASNGVVAYESGSVTGSGELGNYTVAGATAISVQFSITGATMLPSPATNSVQIHGSVDGTTYVQIGGTYSGTGDFTTTLNYSLISDTTVPYKIKVVIVDGGAGTMVTTASILAVRG